MINPVVYIFINKSLHMSAGKVGAQAAHAAMMGAIGSRTERRREWLKSPHRTIIVLEARDADHIHNIEQYLFERGFGSKTIIDEGVNEIDPHVPTALTTAILDKDNELVYKTFSSFSLYKDPIKINLELDR